MKLRLGIATVRRCPGDFFAISQKSFAMLVSYFRSSRACYTVLRVKFPFFWQIRAALSGLWLCGKFFAFNFLHHFSLISSCMLRARQNWIISSAKVIDDTTKESRETLNKIYQTWNSCKKMRREIWISMKNLFVKFLILQIIHVLRCEWEFHAADKLQHANNFLSGGLSRW